MKIVFNFQIEFVITRFDLLLSVCIGILQHVIYDAQQLLILSKRLFVFDAATRVIYFYSHNTRESKLKAIKTLIVFNHMSIIGEC